MNFYEEIVHKIFTQNTTIGQTRLYWKSFIEAMQDKAEFKGVPYYSNIILASPNHFGANLYPDIFKETLEYCKQRIDEIELGAKPERLPLPVFNHFRDLLRIPSDLEFCLDALRTGKKPTKSVIDDNNNYTLGPRKKAVFATWVTSLRDLGYLKDSATYEEIARLLPTIILNLSVTEKTLRSQGSLAVERYSAVINSRLTKY